jgi:uncharacterized integral membrane protein
MPEKVITKLIAILILFILLIVFAIQNFGQQSRITVFFWELEKIPVSIIIFVSILIGALIAVVELLPHVVRLRRRARSAEAEVEKLKLYGGEAPRDTGAA